MGVLSTLLLVCNHKNPPSLQERLQRLLKTLKPRFQQPALSDSEIKGNGRFDALQERND